MTAQPHGTTNFKFTPMVRVDYSCPNLDQPTRLKMSKIIFDFSLQRFSGGGGGPEGGTLYVPASEVEGLRSRLSEIGFNELVPEVV